MNQVWDLPAGALDKCSDPNQRILLEVLEYRINRIHDFIIHQRLYDAEIVLGFKTYIDVHLPLIDAIMRSGELPFNWKNQYDPDRIVPCFEGSLPDITALLTRCTVWGPAKDQKQLLARLIVKAMFQLRCYVRWLAPMTLLIYKTQQAAYDATLPAGAAKRAAQARARKVENLPKKHHPTTTKIKIYRAIDCEKIPESDDVLEYLRRIILCTLLGNYKTSRVFVEFPHRLKLYRQFEWQIDRFSFLEWVLQREGIEFYALKENVAKAMEGNPAMLELMRDISRWDSYVASTREGCDRIIRNALNQSRDNSINFPEIKDEDGGDDTGGGSAFDPNGDDLMDISEDVFLGKSRKALDHLRRKQLMDAERKAKPGFTEFARNMLRAGLNARQIQERLALVPPDKERALQVIIPRMPPENGADWFVLIALGLSQKSMLTLLRLEDAYSGVISEPDWQKVHLPKLSPYAWACAYKFFDGFEQCYSIRLFDAPARWYEKQVNALRLRMHVPPGCALPPTAGLLLYCPVCKHIRCELLPPGTGTEADIQTEVGVSNGRLTFATAPKNKRKRKRQPTVETISLAYRQAALGPSQVSVNYENGMINYYCIGTKDTKKRKDGDTAPICGQQPLMKFDLKGKIFQSQNHCVCICCLCGSFVVFELRYQSGKGGYLCKYCQYSVCLQQQIEHKRSGILQERLADARYERKLLLKQIQDTSVEAGLTVPTMIEEEKEMLDRLDARIRDLKTKLAQLQPLGELWPMFPSQYKVIGLNEIPTVLIELKEPNIEYQCAYCHARRSTDPAKPPATYVLYGGVNITLCYNHNRRCIKTRAQRMRDYTMREVIELIRRDIFNARARFFRGKWHDRLPTWNVEPYTMQIVLIKRERSRAARGEDPRTDYQKRKQAKQLDLRASIVEAEQEEIQLEPLKFQDMRKIVCFAECEQNPQVTKACDLDQRGNTCLKLTATPDWDFIPQFQLIPERMYHCHGAGTWHIWGDIDTQERLEAAWKLCQDDFGKHMVCHFCNAVRVVSANRLMSPLSKVTHDIFLCCHGHLFGHVALKS